MQPEDWRLLCFHPRQELSYLGSEDGALGKEGTLLGLAMGRRRGTDGHLGWWPQCLTGLWSLCVSATVQASASLYFCTLLSVMWIYLCQMFKDFPYKTGISDSDNPKPVGLQKGAVPQACPEQWDLTLCPQILRA